jgi:hypothetical protein
MARYISIFNEWEALPVFQKKDGTVEHIYANGSRFHVICYSSRGMGCSEKDCELNKDIVAVKVGD